MIYKKGDKGENVKKIQKALGVGADGIFGVKTEAAVKQFQKDNNLKYVDGIVGNETWGKLFPNEEKGGDETDDIKITEGFIKTHITKSPNRPIKYLAIHYTAGGSSKKGSALGVRNVFLKRSASADFAVDDETILQINPDLKNYYCWAVGDKKNPYSSGGSLYGKASNKNTISIEMCSNLKKGTSSSAANHAGWTLTEETIANTIKLSKYLMKKYNIPLSNVVRHYDISGKVCPGVVGWNDEPLYTESGTRTKEKNNSGAWKSFKERLSK